MYQAPKCKHEMCKDFVLFYISFPLMYLKYSKNKSIFLPRVQNSNITLKICYFCHVNLQITVLF